MRAPYGKHHDADSRDGCRGDPRPPIPLGMATPNLHRQTPKAESGMSDYLTRTQVDKLLAPIKPSRVSKDGKGFSHIEAYELRATLNRLFGFARWSAELTDLTEAFTESVEKVNRKGDPYNAWTVCYRATVRLTVCAPDGTPLAVYTEAAAGDAQNYPSRADAVDMAIKTAESQALKRCAVNLGDVAGLSLYANGSLGPLVRMTLHYPFTDGESASGVDVDAHVVETVPEAVPNPEAAVEDVRRQFARPVAELDREANPGDPEAARQARLVEAKVRREALGVDSSGRTAKGSRPADRAPVAPGDDPWAVHDAV